MLNFFLSVFVLYNNELDIPNYSLQQRFTGVTVTKLQLMVSIQLCLLKLVLTIFWSVDYHLFPYCEFFCRPVVFHNKKNMLFSYTTLHGIVRLLVSARVVLLCNVVKIATCATFLPYFFFWTKSNYQSVFEAELLQLTLHDTYYITWWRSLQQKRHQMWNGVVVIVIGSRWNANNVACSSSHCCVLSQLSVLSHGVIQLQFMHGGSALRNKLHSITWVTNCATTCGVQFFVYPSANVLSVAGSTWYDEPYS